MKFRGRGPNEYNYRHPQSKLCPLQDSGCHLLTVQSELTWIWWFLSHFLAWFFSEYCHPFLELWEKKKHKSLHQQLTKHTVCSMHATLVTLYSHQSLFQWGHCGPRSSVELRAIDQGSYSKRSNTTHMLCIYSHKGVPTNGHIPSSDQIHLAATEATYPWRVV